MSRQPHRRILDRRFFVVMLQHGVPQTIAGTNGVRVVPTDRTLEEVVRQRNLGDEKPLLGWRTVAGADKNRPQHSPMGIDGWTARVYERRAGKLVSL